jgi:hypothetical protein
MTKNKLLKNKKTSKKIKNKSKKKHPQKNQKTLTKKTHPQKKHTKSRRRSVEVYEKRINKRHEIMKQEQE